MKEFLYRSDQRSTGDSKEDASEEDQMIVRVRCGVVRAANRSCCGQRVEGLTPCGTNGVNCQWCRPARPVILGDSRNADVVHPHWRAAVCDGSLRGNHF